MTDEERIEHWKGAYDRMSARSIEDGARIAALEAELSDYRNGSALMGVLDERKTLRDTLRSVAAILPKYAMKGETAGDDEALDAVIEQVNEALEPSNA